MANNGDFKGKEITFYIFYPKSSESDYYKDVNQFGTIETKRKYLDKGWSYHNEFIFTPNKGFEVLSGVISKFPERIGLLKIKNSENKEYSVEQFLNILEYCIIKK